MLGQESPKVLCQIQRKSEGKQDVSSPNIQSVISGTVPVAPASEAVIVQEFHLQHNIGQHYLFHEHDS